MYKDSFFADSIAGIVCAYCASFLAFLVLPLQNIQKNEYSISLISEAIKENNGKKLELNLNIFKTTAYHSISLHSIRESSGNLFSYSIALSEKEK